MKTCILLILFLITIGLSGAAIVQDNQMDNEDPTLTMIPVIFIDWFNQAYNWVLLHLPQIKNWLQNKINNLPFDLAKKEFLRTQIPLAKEWFIKKFGKKSA